MRFWGCHQIESGIESQIESRIERMNHLVTVTHRTLATVDLVIIGLYFLIVFAIGFYFARKERSSTDYFLAGRNIGWFAIGASLFVSNISTEHFIGLAGSGASTGLAVGHFEWLACLILLILGWVFVPDRKSTRLNSSHLGISYAVFC